MNLHECLIEGKLDKEGIKKIEELIEENKKLRDGFGYATREIYYVGGDWIRIFSKEDIFNSLDDLSDELKKERIELRDESEKVRRDFLEMKDVTNDFLAKNRELENEINLFDKEIKYIKTNIKEISDNLSIWNVRKSIKQLKELL